jgi:hypothetical protein
MGKPIEVILKWVSRLESADSKRLPTAKNVVKKKQNANATSLKNVKE